MFENEAGILHNNNVFEMKGAFALQFIVAGGPCATILTGEVPNLVILLPLGIQ